MASTAMTHAATTGAEGTGPRELSILLYSDDITTRDAVRAAVGRRPSRNLAVSSWLECATLPAVLEAVESERFDLLILDGEAAPAGGLGVCRQLKNEIFDCPPVLVLTGRAQDVWLAAWSLADAAVSQPLDALAVCAAVEQAVAGNA
ncbi:MAG: hypothetical protein LKG20_09000 [Tetrasphaera jenkinsii]|jgi:DNA-binding response OmpR family regulator|nr:hypothetical protein [Tetrasphaera jenkinsii]